MAKQNDLSQFGNHFYKKDVQDIETAKKELKASVLKEAEAQGYKPFPETSRIIDKEETFGYIVWCIEKSKLVGE